MVDYGAFDEAALWRDPLTDAPPAGQEVTPDSGPDDGRGWPADEAATRDAPDNENTAGVGDGTPESQVQPRHSRWPVALLLAGVVVAVAVVIFLVMNRAIHTSNDSVMLPGPTATSSRPPSPRQDISKLTCAAAADGSGVVITGRVTNSTGAAANYRLILSVVVGTQTLGTNDVNVQALASHDSKDWSVTVAAKTASPVCVLAVERSTA